MTITANELKTKGVSLIESIIDKNENAIITVHGKERYVVMRMEEYNRIRELELDLAIQQSRADLEAGKVHADGIDAHIQRITDV